MEKQNPPAYGAQSPGQPQPVPAASYPQAVPVQQGQYVQPQQQPMQAAYPQQQYGIPMQQVSPQPMAGQPIGHSPSPHAQQPYGQPPLQQQGYTMPQQQGYVHPQAQAQAQPPQPGMVYQKPQMMQTVQPQPQPQQPGFATHNSGGIITQQPGAGNAHVPGAQVYQSAVPLATLGESPAPIDCPSCHQRGLTATTHVVGQCTHLWALAAFAFTCCLCCVPYLVDAFKDTVHKCSKCGVTVATFKKSGGTQVHAFA